MRYMKSCKQPDNYTKTCESFQREYSHMNHLYEQMKRQNKEELYTRLFPRYYPPVEIGHQLSLSMDRIPGISLEEYLCHFLPHSAPHAFFSACQILKLYEQLQLAIYWLFQGHMLHLDLSPKNILILNQPAMEIRLIDFTDCYYTDLSYSENRKRGYKIIDHRINPDLSPSLQLRSSCALLFTRLFFAGNENYQRFFSLSLQTDKGIENYRFFHRRYPHLLDFLFSSENQTAVSQDNITLTEWETWYDKLRCQLISSY